MVYFRSIAYTTLMFFSFLLLASLALIPFLGHKQRWDIAKYWAEINIWLSKHLWAPMRSKVRKHTKERCILLSTHLYMKFLFC